MRDKKILSIPTQTDTSWSFSNISKAGTTYASHGYHRYPAKFIPQIVKKLLINYSLKGDIVLDPFGGCGTTSVEAKLNGRNSIGIDINKIATLISKAKTKEIVYDILKRKNEILLEKIKKQKIDKDYYNDAPERLKFWFKPQVYNKLYGIYKCINEEKNPDIKKFYLCCFSNILKTSSIWYSKSVKPMRDFNKNILDPDITFTKHLDFMTKQNAEFNKIIKNKKIEKIFCKIKVGDAKNLNLKKDSVDLIITSPPYVTSYEYAEIHQISTLWFGYSKDIKKLSKKFVGTSSKNIRRVNINSEIALSTLRKLYDINERLGNKISSYFFDIQKCYSEFYRILKNKKYLCIIIGDTEYHNIKIQNVKISLQLLSFIGFDIKKIIKRKLSSKIFTPYRDNKGRFASANKKNKRRVYQYEYIILAKKI